MYIYIFRNQDDSFSDVILVWDYCDNETYSGGFKGEGGRGGGGGGGDRRPPPPQIFIDYVFSSSHFVSECSKNKAQITRESIKNSEGFCRALKRVLHPGRNELRAPHLSCACTHIIFCAPPPPMKILDPPLNLFTNIM